VTAARAAAGTVAPGFEDVRAAFEQNGETGGAFAATVDGELVADLWRGVAQPDPRLELVYGIPRATPEVWNDLAVLPYGEDEDFRARSLLAALHNAVERLPSR
jgi:hypothetical protein